MFTEFRDRDIFFLGIGQEFTIRAKSYRTYVQVNTNCGLFSFNMLDAMR